MRLSNMQCTSQIFHLKFYFGPIFASLVWSSTQYTGLIDDYIMLAICIGAGMLMKYLKIQSS